MNTQSAFFAIDSLHVARRLARLLAWGVALLTMGATAQTPLPAPDLQLLDAGSVEAIVQRPDGSIVFGGWFRSVNGTERNHLARLRPDGTLDPDWHPIVDGAVLALGLAADGAIYVSGWFGTVDGAVRPGLAKFDGAIGALDSAWQPVSHDWPIALVVGADGSVYVGGGGSVDKLSGDSGEQDPNWHRWNNQYGYIDALAVDPQGDVFAGGAFESYGDYSRDRIVKLDGVTGEPVAEWIAGGLGSSSDDVRSIVTDTDGAVYVGGGFGLRKLSVATGEEIANWIPSVGDVRAISLDIDGAIYVGGRFDYMGGAPRSSLAKLSRATGQAMDGWSPEVDRGVSAFAFAADGSLFAGGYFTHVDGAYRMGLAQVSSDYGVVIGIGNDVETPGAVLAMAERPGGGLVLGGRFQKSGQTRHGNLLRLNPDGSLDPQWNPSPNDAVSAVAVAPDDSVYAAGHFTTIGGLGIASLAKLSAVGEGAADANWWPRPNARVRALAVDASGDLFIGGDFTRLGSTDLRYLAKLTAGAAFPSWGWGMTCCSVNALAIDSGNALYVGGLFSSIGGYPRDNIAKFSLITGQIDELWNPASDSIVYALALDRDGSVYAAGMFSTIGGLGRALIAKLSGATGAADAGWSANISLSSWPYDDYVLSLALDRNGTLYAAGFYRVGAGSELHLGRMSGTNGRIDPGWNPFPPNLVAGQPAEALLATNDGMYVGGYFDTVRGVPRNGFAAFAITLPDSIFIDAFELTP